MVYAGYSIQKNILLFYQNQRNDKKKIKSDKKKKPTHRCNGM